MGNMPGNFASGVILSLIVSVAAAQQLPKSGSISVHTGWKSTGEAVEVADKRMQGHGSVFGITFNDQGAGPLHGGPASCFYVFFAGDTGTRNKGYCAFGDADGDRIFTDWHGSQGAEGGQGINEIVGETASTSASRAVDRGCAGTRVPAVSSIARSDSITVCLKSIQN